MTSSIPDELLLRDKLEQAQTIVVIGCSEKKHRTSYHIARYLQNKGYRIVPVNPNIEETLDKKSYAAMDRLPKDMNVDIVDIFRNKKYTEDMVKQIVKWSQKTGQKPLVWTQLDVSTPGAKQAAEEAGLLYVENRCLMVEHQRLLG